MSKQLFSLGTLALMVCLSGCENFKSWYAAEFKQDEITTGIARLSAQHLSMITNELGKKFKDPLLPTKTIPALDDNEYGKGTVIKTIENFIIEYPNEEKVYEDCFKTEVRWQGKLRVVKAVQTLTGRLTGNPEKPVIPDINGVKIVVEIIPIKSSIKFSDKDSYVRFDEGIIKFEVYPRLAQMQQEGNLKGLRVIPTSNNRFENVTMTNIKGKLYTPKVKVPFEISHSNYFIQIGKGENGDENKLSGEITAFGTSRIIPFEGEVLSPDYEAETFIKSFACKEGLENTVQYKNILFEEKVGAGLAALTTMTMAKIAGKLADDHICGMSSPSFLKTTAFVGKVGENGEAKSTLSTDCIIHFKNYKTEPDCFGVAHTINGQATIKNALKVTKGLIISSASEFDKGVKSYESKLSSIDLAAALAKKPEPILPRSRQPVLIEFTADLSDLTITELCLNQGSTDHEAHCLKQKNAKEIVFNLGKGEVRAVLRPLMGKNSNVTDDRFKMCSVRNLPIADAELTLKGVSASIKKDGNEFKLLASGSYRAVSGLIDNRENQLSGDITIGKIMVPFKSLNHDHVPLKPDYDRQRYVDSYQSCRQNQFTVPQSDNDCDLSDLGL